MLDDAAFGGATPVTPKFISPADPASRWTGANKGLAFFAYATNYLIDLDHAIIVDVEPSTAVRQAEVTAARTMIERAREHHDLWPARLTADTAYGSAEMLDWLVHDQGIEPHIPVIDKAERIDGTFSRSDFAYDHAQTSTAARRARRWSTVGASSRRPGPRRRLMTPCAIAPVRPTAGPAPSSPGAAPTRRCARSRAPSTKAPGTSPATSPGPTPTSSPGANGRRSRCCSPTSSAS
ncbi:hypothetical protein D3C71_1543010 [compost metagenome]